MNNPSAKIFLNKNPTMISCMPKRVRLWSYRTRFIDLKVQSKTYRIRLSDSIKTSKI